MLLFSTNDFSPANFKLVLNQLSRSIKEKSRIEACKVFEIQDGKLESVVSHINQVLESKSVGVREKYKETINKQKSRIAKLQKQLAIAPKELYGLAKAVPDTKMLNEITSVQKSLTEKMNVTDEKMSKLQKLASMK